jgi:enoyl-CoA hydratase/carnithine racemase
VETSAAEQPAASNTIAGVVHRTIDDGVVTLTIERGAHNALTRALSDLLVAALDECAADPGVRVVVLTAAGRQFSSGADLSSGADAFITILEAAGAGEPGYSEPAGRIVLAIGRLGMPLIVAVNGDAIGRATAGPDHLWGVRP